MISSKFPKSPNRQHHTTVTFCLLNRIQSSRYLECLARAETLENNVHNQIFLVLPTHRVTNVKRFLGGGTGDESDVHQPKIIGLVASFFIFPKFASGWVPDGWVKLKISGCRCHFWMFQLELDALDTKNFEFDSVGTKLQSCEVGRFWKILRKSWDFS